MTSKKGKKIRRIWEMSSKRIKTYKKRADGSSVSYETRRQDLSSWNAANDDDVLLDPEAENPEAQQLKRKLTKSDFAAPGIGKQCHSSSEFSLLSQIDYRCRSCKYKFKDIENIKNENSNARKAKFQG
jgi:hypothetical protein